MTEYVIPYPPSVNHYWIHARGRVILSAKARDYKNLVAGACSGYGIKIIKKPSLVSLSLQVFRPRKSGDLDNTLKAIMDSLQGIAYENDSQVVEIFAARFDNKVNPRVVFLINEIEVENE